MRSVVVTDASTAIGKACAERLRDRGWRVFGTIRREEDATEGVTPLFVDVTDPAAIAAAAEQVGGRLDALRNEIAAAGGRVILVEPGPIRTPIWERSDKRGARIRGALSRRARRVPLSARATASRPAQGPPHSFASALVQSQEPVGVIAPDIATASGRQVPAKSRPGPTFGRGDAETWRQAAAHHAERQDPAQVHGSGEPDHERARRLRAGVQLPGRGRCREPRDRCPIRVRQRGREGLRGSRSPFRRPRRPQKRGPRRPALDP